LVRPRPVPEALPAVVEIVPAMANIRLPRPGVHRGKTELYVSGAVPAAVEEEVARIAIAAHTGIGTAADRSRTDLTWMSGRQRPVFLDGERLPRDDEDEHEADGARGGGSPFGRTVAGSRAGSASGA